MDKQCDIPPPNIPLKYNESHFSNTGGALVAWPTFYGALRHGVLIKSLPPRVWGAHADVGRAGVRLGARGTWGMAWRMGRAGRSQARLWNMP
jgi:hypothetical protein